ncbi:nucleotidyl transferase AbiEii/AbiGii toxin family protein [bacterium]|nr:nucleotidyl transferase AbiEii/AbiGii toxin family protein [bacterium]
MSLVENKSYYTSQTQQKVLQELTTHPTIEEHFFLTGGTALSIFYLHHRLSEDLDFFALDPLDLSEIDLWIRRKWLEDGVKIKESSNFLSYLINEIKVDFVIDPLSNRESREKILLENGHSLSVDTINNIVSNKFCTIVSRMEPKDFIDLYFIQQLFPERTIEEVYNAARTKDAIFDDPPTAAFQIEEGLDFLKENHAIFPNILRDFDLHDFFGFYNKITIWLYQQVKI